MTDASNSRPITPIALKLIRLALLGGVLAFGLVAWFLHRSEGRATMGPDEASGLRIAFFVLLLLESVVLLIVRAKHARAEDFQTTAVASVIGWAQGEAVALFGGVIYLLTGDVTLYLAGLGFLVIAFLLIPIRDTAEQH